jgi:hypothetical protein
VQADDTEHVVLLGAEAETVLASRPAAARPAQAIETEDAA